LTRLRNVIFEDYCDWTLPSKLGNSSLEKVGYDFTKLLKNHYNTD